MTGVWQDVRQALRSLKSDRGFVLTASVILALGIGVNLAVISAARTVFFPTLPFAQARQLAVLYEQARDQAISKFKIPYMSYLLIREQKKIFSGVALYISPDAMPPLDLTQPGVPEKLSGAVVSSNFFNVLGAKPFLGETFVTSNQSDEPQPLAVIGYQFWQERFGGSRSVLGKPLVLNQRVYDVAGVMPPGFSFPGDTEVWLTGSSPATVSSIINSNTVFTEFIPHAVARLQPGITPAQAEVLLRTPLAHLREPHIQGSPHVSLQVVPLYDDLYGNARRPLAILSIAALLVLVIAWSVVSILCWVRAIRHEKEIAVRAALGAGKWRAMLQFVAENGFVSVISGILALLVNEWAARIIPALVPAQGLPLGPRLTDWHVLVYLVIAVALSATVPGIWSAWNATKIDVARTLQEGSYSSSIGRGRSRLISVLVAVLVSLAFILTAGAALMVENFRETTNLPLGWSPGQVWLSSFNLHGATAPSGGRLAAMFANVIMLTERLPGVGDVAIADAAPIPSSSMHSVTVAQAEGSPRQLPLQGLEFDSAAVSPDYFRVLGVPLLQGRWFTEEDCVNSSPVAIVDQSLAHYLWGQRSPIGKRMTASRMDDGRMVTIVGLVGPTKASGYLSPVKPTIYTPIPARLTPSVNWLLVRMRGKVKAPFRGIQDVFSAVGTGAIPTAPNPAEELLGRAGTLPRARAAILSLFGILALALSAFGSYAVTAYVARQRVREFGVRMALGATRGDILKLLLIQTLWSFVLGLVAGWIVVLGATPVFRALAYGARATDVPLFGAVSAIMCCAVLAASLPPAWRVAALDPARVLREE